MGAGTTGGVGVGAIVGVGVGKLETIRIVLTVEASTATPSTITLRTTPFEIFSDVATTALPFLSVLTVAILTVVVTPSLTMPRVTVTVLPAYFLPKFNAIALVPDLFFTVESVGLLLEFGAAIEPDNPLTAIVMAISPVKIALM